MSYSTRYSILSCVLSNGCPFSHLARVRVAETHRPYTLISFANCDRVRARCIPTRNGTPETCMFQHISCMEATFMHVPFMFQHISCTEATSIHVSCMEATFMCIPCMFQHISCIEATSTHETCMNHACFRRLALILA